MKQKWFRLIMSDENSIPNPFHPSEVGFHGIETAQLELGQTIENWHNGACVMSTSADDDGPLNDVLFLDREMIPAFSPRLLLALQKAEVGTSDVQYLPVRVCQFSGDVITGFAVVNVLHHISGLDRDRCFMIIELEDEFDPKTGLPVIAAIGKIAVFPEVLAAHDVVRLSEFPTAFLVSDRFARVFNRGKFTGASLSPLKC